VLRLALPVGEIADRMFEAGLLREWDLENEQAISNALEQVILSVMRNGSTQ
jgi:hypothetical protein